MRIYILGNGAMGSAIVMGLKDKFEVIVVGRNVQNLEKFREIGIKTEIYGSSYDITDKNIILAFKPYALRQMSEILKGTANLVISVLAMTKLSDIECIKARYSTVCLPNIAAEFGSSTTAYFTKSDDALTLEILSSFGRAIKVNSDEEMSVAGVLGGCAPAYLAVVAEALVDAGVKEGLSRDKSLELVNSLFKSSAILLENYHPCRLKELICSPKGTTIEGVYALEKSGIRAAFIGAVRASSNKTQTKVEQI
ncbi:MAG: pyrroline-5-carboxylate reductase [Campylobacter sp.]|nr:pyrroline-5-carboxylate reductase [Campylobacter sp.]